MAEDKNIGEGLFHLVASLRYLIFLSKVEKILSREPRDF